MALYKCIIIIIIIIISLVVSTLLLLLCAACPKNCKNCVVRNNHDAVAECTQCIDKHQLMSARINGASVAGNCYRTFYSVSST